jgi:Protein of unknown function (DUF3662)/FHA domain
VNRAGPARTSGMGLLRSIETGIERVVDGTVGRVVRVSVQPVEIARKLAKELEDGKTESGGRTFVPSQYTVYLPPKDRERFSEYEASLRVELGAYLAEHVRREGYSVLARPRVTFETADELASGTFGIATEREAPSEEPPRRVQAEPIPPVADSLIPEPPLVQAETPMFAPPPFAPAAYEPAAYEPAPIEPEPVAEQYELELEPAEPEPVAELAPAPEPEPAEEAAPLEHEAPPATADPSPSLPSFPTPGLSAPVPSPAPFLPVPAPPLPTPPVVVPPLPDVAPDPPYAAPPPAPIVEPEPEPAPIGVTQTVSAADAARGGLAHAADALVVDGRRYTLTGPLTSIGRSSACDIALDDASASRRHAELRRRGGKTVLVDLDSTNGTLVNGRRVREAPLRAGDRITIGTTTIVFERVS